MNNGSFSGGKIVWLPGSLLPIFIGTAYYGAQIILLGFLNTAYLCVGLDVTLQFF